MADAKQVKDACAQMHAAMVTSGGRGVGPSVAAQGLLANGIYPYELDVASLRAALVGLAQSLAHPSGTVIVLQDHRAVWAWCGQICLFTNPPPLRDADWHLHELCVAAVRAYVAQPNGENFRPGGDPNTFWLVTSAKTIASYLPYPLLEGVLKKCCASFIRFDGSVTTAFTVQRADGTDRNYGVGARCSNLGHLLQLLVATTKDKELEADIRAVLEFVAPGNSVASASDVIFGWRNGSLHGEDNTPAGGAVVLQLSLLIILSMVASEYEKRRKEALATAQLASETPIGIPQSFYPHS